MKNRNKHEKEVGMLLSAFGGLLFGSGAQVLFSSRPLYPKPVGAMFVVVGGILAIVGIVTPAVLW